MARLGCLRGEEAFGGDPFWGFLCWFVYPHERYPLVVGY